MLYKEMTEAQRADEYKLLCEKLDEYKRMNLKLDMSRGKPSAEQLELSQGMLGVINSPEDCFTEGGFDCRNYGVLDGIPEAKQIFSEILDVPSKNIIVAGNSSLNIMYDEIARLMLYGAAGVEEPWAKQERIKFLCPVPGYDRHFGICESLGIEMINVDMTPNGPDMNQVEELVRDPSVKGIWCVPKYSNPEGITYSDETVQRFAALKPAAPDFRIFWDNAYIIHTFSDSDTRLLNIFDEAKKYGNEDIVLIFMSTSKISFPGSGVAVMAASDANIAHTKSKMAIQTIGYDKLNMMRHVKFFGSVDGLMDHMKKHADIIKPKFDAVLSTFENMLAPYGVANWTKPIGGYFLSLNVRQGCAKRVYELAKEAGVTLTEAGATFPYKHDPRDCNLRIAPTYPTVEEMETASAILCLCVRAAALEKMIEDAAG
ncbi:MAG: aminotransferase [Oscillospiraceae bacterium]|nr:MAG: aminotransferase [Oscillospiraceae bacterium]